VAVIIGKELSPIICSLTGKRANLSTAGVKSAGGINVAADIGPECVDTRNLLLDEEVNEKPCADNHNETIKRIR
jgi:hypothetical protein